MSILQPVEFKQNLEKKVERDGKLYLAEFRNARFKQDPHGSFIGDVSLTLLSDSGKNPEFYVKDVTFTKPNFELFAENLNSLLLVNYNKFLKYSDAKAFFLEHCAYYSRISKQVRYNSSLDAENKPKLL